MEDCYLTLKIDPITLKNICVSIDIDIDEAKMAMNDACMEYFTDENINKFQICKVSDLRTHIYKKSDGWITSAKTLYSILEIVEYTTDK